MRITHRLLLAAGLALGGGAVAVPSQAAACTSTSGVTVVVTTPGAGTITRCAPGDPSSGLEALRSAGFSVAMVQRFPGAVCRIDGHPANDPCVNMPPSSAYWSYWHANRGGSWSYSQLGAGSYDPAPGTVEGWSFGAGGQPGIAPPPLPPTPRPTTTTPRPSTTSPTRPPSTTPPPRPSTTSPTPRPPRSTTTTPSSGTSSIVVTRDGTTTTLPVPPSSPATTTIPITMTGTVSTTGAGSTSDGVTEWSEATTTDLATGADSGARASTPWPLFIALGAIAAVTAAAFAVRRRNAAH